MLGAQCSPCCCGPEVQSLPTRFEVDVTAIDAPEKHWGLRYAKWFSKFTIAEFSSGYVQNWHAGAIESGTYTLNLLTIVSGVATYEHISAGFILRMTCTPAEDGRYAVFFTCVPARTTTQLWGWVNGIGGRNGLSIDAHDLWTMNSFGPSNLSPPPAVPPTGPRPFETITKMRADSAAIAETPSITGRPSGTGFDEQYTLKQSCHAVTIGTRLACPSVTTAGTSSIDTQQVSANTFLANGNWPLQIRSKARIYIPWIQGDWYFRGPDGTSSPGRQVQLPYPTPSESNIYGSEYNLNFGFSSNFGTGFDSGYLVVVVDSPSAFDVYAWYSNFNREIDITQIRAVFPDTTQQWPET